ncbi:hypothetical protein DENSPDRAFT_849290 [Dentipellis sp. KUC8613]|nr:hypothetical protein DENSPDRAFT_849290 [Dentipellis sp. KUC8613]
MFAAVHDWLCESATCHEPPVLVHEAMSRNALSYVHQLPHPHNTTGESAIISKNESTVTLRNQENDGAQEAVSNCSDQYERCVSFAAQPYNNSLLGTSAPDDTSLTGAHGENGVRELLFDATKLIIKTVREASDAFPPLKATAGGLCAVIESIDIMHRNVNETAQLIMHTEQLVSDYAKEWAQHTNTNNPLKEGMVRLSDEIKAQCMELQQKVERRRWIRFFQGVRDAAFLQDKSKAIREALETFDRLTSLLKRVILKSIKDDVTSIREDTSVIQSNQNNEAQGYRLGKLERYCSSSASFTAYIGDSSSITRRACTTGTRVKVLDEILHWFKLGGNEQLFWLTGHAGSGKTTIAFTICENLKEMHSSAPLVSYFCSQQLDSGASQQLMQLMAILGF